MRKIVLVLALMMITSAPYAEPPENSSDVIKHLEFLGYEVSMDSEYLAAKHSTNMSILIKNYRGGMLTTAFFGGTEYGKINKNTWLSLINKLNQKAVAVRYYLDSDGDMIIQGYYPGDYNKKTFSTYLDAFNLASDNIREISDEIEKYVE